MTTEPETVRAEPAAARDPFFIEEVTRLVNAAYAAGEEGLWAPGTDRTSPAVTAGIVAAGELVVSRLGGRLAGVARVRRLPTGEGGFGMLATDFADRGAGVGRRLVSYAEQWALDLGCATMQLELLVPRGWPHPVKEFLRAWYTRIGYRVVRTDDFAVVFPQLEPKLVAPCDFLIFHKALA
jgi:GNAT superfamily N-acetyltransferase